MNLEDPTPPVDLVKEWIIENGGHVDGKGAVSMRLEDVQSMLTAVTKFVSQAAFQMADVEGGSKSKRIDRTPDKINPDILKALAKIALPLEDMSACFRGSGAEWRHMATKIDAALSAIAEAAREACGRR